MLMPSLLCKMIFPFCLIASMIKTCFCKLYHRLELGLLCYFCAAIMLTDKSSGRRFYRPFLFLKACVKSRHHREHFLQHIKIDALVYGNVLCPALESLFAERPAVEAHIVEVCPFVIDDVKAVGTCLVPCKAHP